jgi:hypothetical protein
LVSATRWNISPAILAAQIDAESSFNPHAVSPDGAVGIAQWLPSTAKAHGVDPYNVASAIDGMAKWDSENIKKYGSIVNALVAYHDGPGGVGNPGPAAQAYVKKILAQAGSALTPPTSDTGILPVNVVGDTLGNVTKLGKVLIDPEFWKRIGIAVAGIGAVVGGIYFVLEKEPGSFQVAKKIGGNIP